jgi:hypothetical protein
MRSHYFEGRMTNINKLYEPWKRRGSYFDLMIDCGDLYNQWVQVALEYLPYAVLDENKERLLFTSTAVLDACRVARHYCENREIILLSERILPKKGANGGQPEVRYFIFAVLHEVAHAIKKHKSKKFDNLTDQENLAQEEEADAISLSWFNEHVKELNNRYIKPLTIEEINEMRKKNQVLMEELYTGNNFLLVPKLGFGTRKYSPLRWWEGAGGRGNFSSILPPPPQPSPIKGEGERRNTFLKTQY